jgi:hypothetical protein
MRFVLSTLAIAALAGVAAADVTNVGNAPMYDLQGNLQSAGYTVRTPSGSTYNVYTGLTNTLNQLFLVESSATPTADDSVTFDGVAEGINNYLTAAGGITRSVNETITPVGQGFDIRVTVTGSGNLFPAGFTSSGNPLSGAGVGLGITLPASLGGADPMNFSPGNFVNSATLTLVRASGAATVFGLPTAFFGGGPVNPWNGVVGVSIGNVATAANAADPFVQVIWDIHTVPAPATLALGACGLVALRRRR